MGKISELELVIEELRNAATAINDAADSLTEMFSTASADESKDNATPAKPVLTLEQVRAVLAEKSRSGHTEEIRALLQKYGANRLSEVEPSDYKALLADAEVLDDAT